MARCFPCENGRDHLDAPQDRERQRADGVVALRREAAGLGLVVDGHRVRILVDREDLRSETDLLRQRAVERVRKLVHAAGDLLHVDVRAADVLAKDLHERVVHVRLEEVHDREVLDRAGGPAAEAEELVERVLVVVANDLLPGDVALPVDHGAELADRLLPQVVGRPAPLLLGEVEVEARGVGVRLLDRHPLATDVHEALRIAHHERPERQPEFLAVRQREAVRTRDAHRAGLGVEAGRERAKRVDPATDAVLRLDHDDVVTLPLQLVGGHQPGEPGTDDHHALRRLVLGSEPSLGDGLHGGRQRRALIGRWLRRAVGKVLRQIGHGGYILRPRITV